MGIFSNSTKTSSGVDSARRIDPASLSIVAGGTTIVGDIDAGGVVKIEGQVQGSVRAAAQVLIAKGGVVRGDIFTREAIVGGDIHGAIQAEERVEIQTGAMVHGDVLTPRIVIAEGGRVNGQITMEPLTPRGSTPEFVAEREGYAV